MVKRFAEGTSVGPNISNLQLRFWQLAVKEFNGIKEKWDEHAIEDDEDDDDDDYANPDFVVDAAVAIILAGTSITELYGQNVGDGFLGKQLNQQYGGTLPDDVKEFLDLYNGVKHFGPTKYDSVSNITEESLCKVFITARKLWLKLRPDDVSHEDFEVQFELT